MNASHGWGAFILGVWAVAITGGLFGSAASEAGDDRFANMFIVGMAGLFAYWIGRKTITDPEL
jgi:hypothetical protein